MQIHRSNEFSYLFAAALSLIALAGSQFSAPTLAYGQADSAKRPQRPAAQPSGAGTPTTPAAKLFGQFCAKCHGADGTGKAVRGELPKIPSFTDAAWQMRRKDAQLAVSILDGTGTSMPSFSGKIDEQQARALVMHIRAFAPAAKKPQPKESKPPNATAAPAPGNVEEQLLGLKQEMDELREQFRRLSGAAHSSSADKSTEVKPAVADQPAARAAIDPVAARTLFAQHCKRCHGTDGTGSAARDRLERIPNFTEAAWQARRSDAQLVASILNGKGGKMPQWRDKISDGQVRGLVAHVRSFAPAGAKPLPAEQLSPAKRAPREEQQQTARPKPAPPSAASLCHISPWCRNTRLEEWTARLPRQS